MSEIKVRLEDNKTQEPVPTTIKVRLDPKKFGKLDSSTVMPIIYIVLGLFMFFSLLVMFNTYVIHLKIDTAVVSSPIESMVSPASGFITDVYVSPGSEVKKNTPLIKIENLDLERDLELARLQVEDSQLNISYFQQLLANEQQRLNLYKGIGINRVSTSQAQVDEAKQEASAAERNLKRMQYLHNKHYITDFDWDKALVNKKTADEKIKSAMAHMNVENDSLHAVDKGMYFTGEKLEGIATDLSAQIAAEEKRLHLNEARLKIYETLYNKLTLLAPFDGKVTQILKAPGSTTDNVKPVLLIEETSGKKQIIAYLTQEEIEHVGHSGRVKIYIPATGNTYHGHVVNIDRTSGFVDEIKAQFRWRDMQVDRSAAITIDIDRKYLEKFNKDVSAGSPAIVYFSKKFTFF